MSGFVVGLITMVHIVVCIGLMAAILLQSGKGGGLAGAFGAGSSQTLFGGRGAATFLSRATTFLAVTFFITSLTLGLQASRSGGAGRSLIQEEARKRGQQREATEAPTAGTQPAPGPSAGQPPVTGVNQPSVTGVALPAPSQAPPAKTPAPSAGTGTQAPAGGGTQTPAGGATQAPASDGTQAPTTGGK